MRCSGCVPSRTTSRADQIEAGISPHGSSRSCSSRRCARASVIRGDGEPRSQGRIEGVFLALALATPFPMPWRHSPASFPTTEMGMPRVARGCRATEVINATSLDSQHVPGGADPRECWLRTIHRELEERHPSATAAVARRALVRVEHSPVDDVDVGFHRTSSPVSWLGTAASSREMNVPCASGLTVAAPRFAKLSRGPAFELTTFAEVPALHNR
jgi:hypothetical protein